MSETDGAVSLETWYADLAPLTEQQRLCVSRVSAWVNAAPAVAVDDDVRGGTSDHAGAP